MPGFPLESRSLRELTHDGRLLFLTRMTRLFAYGLISVVLVLYLAALGLGDTQIGVLLSLTLVGDTVISLWLTTHADRWGRRLMLRVGASLMILAGVVFAVTKNPLLLLLAATVGVISPSGNEVGPFLSIEQAALSHVVPGVRRTEVFAWYALTGSLSTALGALAGGVIAQGLRAWMPPADGYRAVVLVYAALGGVLIPMFSMLSPSVEVPHDAHGSPKEGKRARFGLQHSQRIVFRLSALFALDAFAGGFVIQSIVAYWFHVRFAVEPAVLGSIFFGANLFAGISALAAARVAARFGLINTMVFTHVPSNLLLILVPLMPNLPLAITMLLLRFSISQMDVPTRQSYTMAIVRPEERAAAAGVTGVARTTGASISPMFAQWMLGSTLLLNGPFILGGSLKIIYDWLLYRSFRSLKPPEELGNQPAKPA